MNADTTELEEEIMERLETVLDPCSTFTERPQSILDLGLVETVTIDGRDVTVHLLPTNQLCMYIPHMMEDIENRIRGVSAVESISVEVVNDKVWTQDRMTREAKREREEYFSARVEAHELTPAYDGETWTNDVSAESKQDRDD